MLDFIKALLDGKKTYLVAIAGLVAAGCSLAGEPWPAWVLTALGAAGLAALRSGVTKNEKDE